MKCRFELTYFYDILTYLKTIRAKVVMFGEIEEKANTKCTQQIDLLKKEILWLNSQVWIDVVREWKTKLEKQLI
jgi:hypothetical protein